MKVIPYEVGRYRVTSQTTNTWYLVDVLSDDCDCPAKKFHPEKRCKHLKVSREVFCDQLIEQIKQHQKPK